MVNLSPINMLMTILIFGAAVRPDGAPSQTLRRRVEAAIAFAKDHPRARFMPTGAIGRHGPSEASVMAALLNESGVNNDRIFMDETGRDTLSSVRVLRLLLRKHQPNGRVMVATSAYHLPRCLALLCFAGIPALPCPPPPMQAASSFRKRWFWRLREVPALPYDVFLVLWLRSIRRL